MVAYLERAGYVLVGPKLGEVRERSASVPPRDRHAGAVPAAARPCCPSRGTPVLSQPSLGAMALPQIAAKRRHARLAVVSDGAAPPVDPGSLLRSKSYRVLLVLAAAIGVVVSVAASGVFLELVAGAGVARGGRDHCVAIVRLPGTFGAISRPRVSRPGRRLKRLSFQG